VGEGVLRRAGSPGRLLDLFAEAGLSRNAGTLVFSGVPLNEIAEGVGTPVFAYNAEAVRSRYRTLDESLAPVPHRVCFAVKANSNLAVLRILRDLGAGADIVSGGELSRALAAGFSPDRIVFSGVGKTAEELQAAVKTGVGHLNIESREELELLGRIADAQGKEVQVGIRVNPGVTTEPFIEGIGRLLELIERLKRLGVTTLRIIDIGGGLGIRYAEEPSLDPAAFASAVLPLLAPTGLMVYLEPGRFLVGSAGVLLTRVLYRKHSGGKEFVVVDAGMNDLVRPSHYQAYHEIVEVEERRRPPSRVDVVGPVCETGDFLALDRMLPGLVAGDALAVLGAGAYGFVMASNYNSRPRPAEVVVDEGRWWVARPREKIEELFRAERLAE
jgi:diaminopimelate decarboxylase